MTHYNPFNGISTEGLFCYHCGGAVQTIYSHLISNLTPTGTEISPFASVAITLTNWHCPNNSSEFKYDMLSGALLDVDETIFPENDTFIQPIESNPTPQDDPIKVYAVMEAGVEYNDEIYYSEGWRNLGIDAFTSVEDARGNARVRLRALLAEFTVRDLVYAYDMDQYPKVQEWATATEQDLQEATWADFIDCMESAGESWIQHVPMFVTIKQLNLTPVA